MTEGTPTAGLIELVRQLMREPRPIAPEQLAVQTGPTLIDRGVGSGGGKHLGRAARRVGLNELHFTEWSCAGVFLGELDEHGVTFGVGDGPADVVDQHPVGESGG
jgi:hypothetical protein